MAYTVKAGVFSLPEKMTGVEAIRYASSIGAGAFEPLAALDLPEPGAAECAAMRAEAEKLGIALPCLSVGISLTGNRADEAVMRLKGCADAAGAMGMKYLHHTVCLTISPEEASAPFEAVLEEALPRVREVYDYAAERGIECIYEDQGFYFNGQANLSAFLDALGRPAGIVLDMGNIAFVGEKPADLVRRFAGRIVHVHMKDYKIRPYEEGKRGYRIGRDMLVPALPGDGDLAVAEAVRALKDAGFDGWYMTEHEALGDGYAENADCLRRTYEMLKA